MDRDQTFEKVSIAIEPTPETFDGLTLDLALERPGRPAGDILRESVRGPADGVEARIAVGLGQPPNLGVVNLRKVGEKLAAWASERPDVRKLGIPAAPLLEKTGPEGVQAFCEGLLLSTFHLGAYRTRHAARPGRLEILLFSRDPEEGPALHRSLERARALAAGVNLTRTWAHEPPNLLNPETLAERSRTLAESTGLSCRVLDEADLVELGAGALVAVGQASLTPSRLIILEYPGSEPEGKPARDPVVLVGKAITFDTGGYTIKTREGLVGMKFDKCGGLTVLGAMRALVELKPDTPVVGIIPAAENMISGQAYRPNDIVTTLSGQTVEIISTDAEGRLILADALSYATRAFKPAALIDVATLTSGIVIALGKVRAGLMANHDSLAAALIEAGEQTGERLWRMPLDPEYMELLWSPDADFRNSSLKSQAHPVIGGVFLQQFVPAEVPWAHLDIAGTATIKPVSDYNEERATGFGVRLLAAFVESFRPLS